MTALVILAVLLSVWNFIDNRSIRKKVDYIHTTTLSQLFQNQRTQK